MYIFSGNYLCVCEILRLITLIVLLIPSYRITYPVLLFNRLILQSYSRLGRSPKVNSCELLWQNFYTVAFRGGAGGADRIG